MEVFKNILYMHLDDNVSENKYYYDLLRYTLDARVYYYGEHFKAPHERYVPLKEKIKTGLVELIIELVVFFRALFYKKSNKVNILSTAYFNINTLINNSEIYVSRPPWAYSGNINDIYDYTLFKKVKKVRNTLQYGTFNTLISQEFIDEIKELEFSLKQFVIDNKIKALFLPADIGFFEKLAIKIFKELNLQSFNFTHGLPGVYNLVDYNRADFLVVWGEAIKQNFINVGFNPDKIIVSGHPMYQIRINDALKFGFDNILIVSKSLPGQQYSTSYVLTDRSNLIYYLRTIQSVLVSFGVKRVRLRLHPCENPNWYLKFIDNGFFKIDDDNLEISLNKSSLVIGPTSTVFLESLIAGVNYTVYEPRLQNGVALDGYDVVPPFDGNNNKVPVATSMEELRSMLESKKKVDVSVLEEYIAPQFNPSLVIDLILGSKINNRRSERVIQ